MTAFLYNMTIPVEEFLMESVSSCEANIGA